MGEISPKTSINFSNTSKCTWTARNARRMERMTWTCGASGGRSRRNFGWERTSVYTISKVTQYRTAISVSLIKKIGGGA
jgi:hypothetical protein